MAWKVVRVGLPQFFLFMFCLQICFSTSNALSVRNTCEDIEVSSSQNSCIWTGHSNVSYIHVVLALRSSSELHALESSSSESPGDSQPSTSTARREHMISWLLNIIRLIVHSDCTRQEERCVRETFAQRSIICSTERVKMTAVRIPFKAFLTTPTDHDCRQICVRISASFLHTDIGV